MNTALWLGGTTAAERLDWTYFCSLLGARYGQIDPEAEYRDKLQNLTQSSLTAAEYRHAVQHCVAGITALPLSEGDITAKQKMWASSNSPAWSKSGHSVYHAVAQVLLKNDAVLFGCSMQ